MKLIEKFHLLCLLVSTADSFQPNCDPNNQFRFHCFPIQYCDNYDCYNNHCGRFAINSKIVRVIESKIIPKCAFTNADALLHISAVNSNIEVVSSGSFVNLPKLDSINLSFNVIKQLHGDTFKNVSAKSLDLSWNKLVYIQENAFHELRYLRYLNLSKNELSTLPIHQIPSLLTELNLSYNLFQRILLTSRRAPSLTDIDLSNNQLNKVALSFDSSMKKIDLSQNYLSKLDVLDILECEELKIFSNRFSFVPEPLTYISVKKIALYPNPWKCDELQTLWIHLQNNFVTLLLDNTVEKRDVASPICVVSEKDAIRIPGSYKDSKACKSDEHCADEMICRNERCLDPCNENACDSSSVCTIINHRVFCFCPENTKRDPKEVYSPCQKVECFTNKDCSLGEYCSSERKCIKLGVFNPGASHGFNGSETATGEGYNPALFAVPYDTPVSFGAPVLHNNTGGQEYTLPIGNESNKPASDFWSTLHPVASSAGTSPDGISGNEDDEMWWTYEIPNSSSTHKINISH